MQRFQPSARLAKLSSKELSGLIEAYENDIKQWYKFGEEKVASKSTERQKTIGKIVE